MGGTMTTEITCFKAYDIRGRVPDQLNEDIAYRIGRAYAALLSPERVGVGVDIRLTSEALRTAAHLLRYVLCCARVTRWLLW